MESRWLPLIYKHLVSIAMCVLSMCSYKVATVAILTLRCNYNFLYTFPENYMFLNQGKFRQNGGCGYVLKPKVMIDPSGTGSY